MEQKSFRVHVLDAVKCSNDFHNAVNNPGMLKNIDECIGPFFYFAEFYLLGGRLHPKGSIELFPTPPPPKKNRKRFCQNSTSGGFAYEKSVLLQKFKKKGLS